VLTSALQGIVPGLVAGTLLSIASVRALRGFVYGISPGDPLSLVLALLVLGTIGIAATLIPAARATRVDPLIAMRAE
jgi:ABC-type antimicrobial peptide transport system permease subunit